DLTPWADDPFTALFGEGGGRIVMTAAPEAAPIVERRLPAALRAPLGFVGRVEGQGEITVRTRGADPFTVPGEALRRAFETGLADLGRAYGERVASRWVRVAVGHALRVRAAGTRRPAAPAPSRIARGDPCDDRAACPRGPVGLSPARSRRHGPRRRSRDAAARPEPRRALRRARGLPREALARRHRPTGS